MSPGLAESVCVVLRKRLIDGMNILTLQIWPRLRRSHSMAVLSGTRTIGGIIRRCLRCRTYHTILGLHRFLWRKPDGSQTPQRDGVGWMVGAACGTDKLGSYWSLLLWGVGVAVRCGGKLHVEECCKASPCLSTRVKLSLISP